MFYNPKLIAIFATMTVLAAAPASQAQQSTGTPQSAPNSGPGTMGPGMMQGGGMMRGGGMSGTSGNPQQMMQDCAKMMQGQSMPGMSEETRRQMVERCRTMQQTSPDGQPQPPATAPQQKE